MKNLFDENLRIQAEAARNLRAEVNSQTIELQTQTRDALRMRARAEIARLNAVASQAEADDLRQAAEEDAKKLRELDQQKTAFFQNMSHELRTPLTLILNPLENQSRREPSNTELLAATKNARRLLRLVNQLLDFQKLGAGKKKLKLTNVNLVHFTHVVGDYFATSCVAKGISFQTTLDGRVLTKDSAEIIIEAEADALEKVAFNFLSNAYKYTPNGGCIELGLRHLSDNRVRLFVTDTGTGISAEGQAKLFRVFSQVEESTTREYEGTGLGLALAKSLVEEMTGQIGVESSVGAGSTFFADFPMLDVSPETVLKPLLVVEDDEATLRMYRLSLGKIAELAEFDQALDYRSAEVLLDQHRYRLVVSDANIPGGDGVELLTRIRNKFPRTKLVLITGSHVEDRFQQALRASRIDEILLKPVELPDLRRVLKHWHDSYDTEESTQEDFRARPWLLADAGETGIETDVREEGGDSTDLEGRGQVVLVVDDLEDMRTLIGNVLIERGYRVLKAANGKQGYEVICERRPDLVISDWMMPKLSGPDLLRRVRANQAVATIPFILLTAKSDEESKLIGTEIGADIFLGKPFNDQELSSAVRNLLSLKSREKEVERLNVYITESVLKRYLPPALIRDILSGQLSMDKPAELRKMTVLFSDLKGFTRTSEALGPEGISSFLNAYLTVMNEIIFEHGGTIDKFIGDAIMVLFGAPQDMNPSEQVARASRCALAMQARLDALCRGWQNTEAASIRMRIGIHHGPAVVGNFGSAQRSDYTAIGPTVNMASRIESACSAGEVFISSETAALLTAEEVEPVGSFELKGIDEATVLYRLKKVQTHSSS